MPTLRHFVYRCAALAAAVSLCSAGAPWQEPPPGASVVGGERLGQPGVQLAPSAGAPPLPAGLTGQSWVVADAGSGEVLAANNAHLRLPPASTLKMLFADTVLPKFDKSTVHRVTDAELAGMGLGSSMVGIKENLDYRVDDLWRGVFLSSGNDAVRVLAHMNGGIAETVAQMQARAQALGALDTKVVTPDGYDTDGQLSSAYDLTLFARSGLRNPDFRVYCGTRDAQFPGLVDKTTGQRGSFGIANTDRLLGKYQGLIGVKNGYTTNAGATFTGAAERGGRTLLVTVMRPAGYQQVYDETAALLDWGFAAAGKVTPVGRLADPPPAPGAAGTGAGTGSGPSTAAEPPQAAPVEQSQQAAAPAPGGFGWPGWLAAGLCLAAVVGAAHWVRRRPAR
ncbi:D-alanyl-D-alanine carboxypeptidase family protein [Kitasatospora sp. NPDC101801]|uniref:D-alanyl-D-alanine carboxypeptidase family protein n=1 Tax=Kitasatospora sp. NPDC101801 TaxID=3364103 RepID=UPI00381FEB17